MYVGHGLARCPSVARRWTFALTRTFSAQPFPVHAVDFDVFHDYLITTDGSQARVRRRGQGGA